MSLFSDLDKKKGQKLRNNIETTGTDFSEGNFKIRIELGKEYKDNANFEENVDDFIIQI